MLRLTNRQEVLYKKIIENQLNSNSQFLTFKDDADYKQMLILKKLDLIYVSEENSTEASFKLNRKNIKLSLCPSYKVAY